MTGWMLMGPWEVRGAGLDIHDAFSRRNHERPYRTRTDFIILHTTEGPKEGSLRKVRNNGEAHYLVDRAGRVYRIIDKNRVAYHAGRSMWNGRTNLDRVSVGIEMVGYHHRPLTESQLKALRELLRQLQRIYGVPDERVLPHSMVAYGAPNRWHRRPHRGRKRCAMGLAEPGIRRRLGLEAQPVQDPDVRAAQRRFDELIDELSRAMDAERGGPRLQGRRVRTEEGDVYEVVKPGRGRPRDGTVSRDSPVGRATRGKKPGSRVTVGGPDGNRREYTVIDGQPGAAGAIGKGAAGAAALGAGGYGAYELIRRLMSDDSRY
jgi:hypothetical protein